MKHTKKQILEAIAYWEKQIKLRNYRTINESQTLNESKIGDFFGKLFKTKSFIAKQNELLKQKNYKEHPLMKVADEMAKHLGKNAEGAGLFNDCHVRFTNVDVENDGYPQTFSDKCDCIAVGYYPPDPDDSYKGPFSEEDKKKLLDLAKKCGLPDDYKFYDVTDRDGFGVISRLTMRNIVNVNESGGEFEKIDDIVQWCKDKNVKWKKIQKQTPIKIVEKPVVGKTIKTIASNGTSETEKTIKQSDVESSWVVCNVTNEDNKWLVKDKIIKKDYVKSDGKAIDEVKPEETYTPKKDGDGRLYAPLADYSDTGISFVPPNWGGAPMNLDKDGYLFKVPGDEKDIYPVSIIDFETTYKPAK